MNSWTDKHCVHISTLCASTRQGRPKDINNLAGRALNKASLGQNYFTQVITMKLVYTPWSHMNKVWYLRARWKESTGNKSGPKQPKIYVPGTQKQNFVKQLLTKSFVLGDRVKKKTHAFCMNYESVCHIWRSPKHQTGMALAVWISPVWDIRIRTLRVPPISSFNRHPPGSSCNLKTGKNKQTKIGCPAVQTVVAHSRRKMPVVKV